MRDPDYFYAVLRTGTFRCGLFAGSARELVQKLKQLEDEPATTIEGVWSQPKEAA